MFKQSIFFRIYLGLILLVVLVSVLGYLLLQVINYQRIQEYRESLADSVSVAISESLSQQKTLQQKLDWIEDASNLLELDLSYRPIDEVQLSRLERNRLEQQRSVVRYRANEKSFLILISVADDPKHLLYAKLNIDQITEQQIRAIPIFIWDYLNYYPGQENEYLNKIRKNFQYEMSIQPLQSLSLDSEQIGRLRADQSVVIISDGRGSGASISIFSAKPNSPNEILVIGPIPLFNWLPFQLAAGIAFLSLFILSLGVYGLIVPIQRKLHDINHALTKMQSGDLDVRLPIEGSDELANLSSSYNNMSDHIKRLIEAQRELMRAVSHELRTPVARIRFGLEMLTEEDDYENRAKQVAYIDQDIDALSQLIDEIMTYAKLEQGAPCFEFQPIFLTQILEQIARETSHLEIAKTKKFIVEIPPENLVVDAEYRYLHRVVQNLVGNALRYAQEKVILTAGIDENNFAFIAVEDDGMGIPEQDRSRIFEAFTRLDDSRTRASGGYGLGLSIVGRIAYWFDGEVHVDESPKLGGARFIMRWPAVRQKKDA